MRRTRIIVLQLKEIIYTALFVVLGICLILLLIFMFTNKKETTTPTMSQYVPGVYSSTIVLKDQPVNVEVIVDNDHINSIRLTELSPAVETMYPFLVPTLDNLETQLVNDITLENLDIKTEAKHTSSILLIGIEKALDKARAEQTNTE